MVQLWAYLVSIEQYANQDWPRVTGASNDTARTLAYLRDRLQVPSENILLLTEQNATRAAIISNFQNHLIHNDKIQRGDAILFHFSGHGSHGPAPAGWVAVKGPEEEGEPQLEMIVPWDEGTIEGDTGRPVCGIPDRTIGALLDRLSEARGDNITVVLDCCHSGHGTRGSSDEEFYAEFTPRGLDSNRVQPIDPDVDAHILKDTAHAKDTASKRFRRGGFTNGSLTDHVLMAACGPQEQSIGNRKGGLMTTYWLEALQKEDMYPRTYAEILKYIDKRIEAMRVKHPQITQHPQCEGVVRDRLVFEETMMSADFFAAERRRELGDHVCRIEAGEAHGIEVGTIFELHEMDNRLQSQRTLGSATVTKVHSTYSIAEFPQGIIFADAKCTAMVLQQSYRLQFAVHNAAPNSSSAESTVKHIRDGLADERRESSVLFTEVSERDAADIVLEVDDEGAISFHRLDPHLRHLKTKPPRIEAEDVEYADYPTILNSIARFNKHLALSSRQHPFTDEVKFAFHLLQPSSAGASYDEEEILEPKAEISFENEEATIAQSEDDKYAFLLHNAGPTPLYPYLIYFDPATYAVETWYTAFEAEKATLLPHKTLQLGSSAEHTGSFQFYLPEDAEIDTSFIKLFLLDTQARMEFVNQQAVLGFDAEGENAVRRGSHTRASAADVETKGRWDTIVRKISVVNG